MYGDTTVKYDSLPQFEHLGAESPANKSVCLLLWKPEVEWNSDF